MISRVIAWSAHNLVLIFVGAALSVAGGIYALRSLPSMPSPTSPMSRLSSTRNFPAKPRRWSKTRSPTR